MAKQYLLMLTEAQADILGFSLTRTLRERRSAAETARGRLAQQPTNPLQESSIAATADEQAARIDEVRCLLDVCPTVDADAAAAILRTYCSAVSKP